MGLLYTCPEAASIADLPEDCKESFGQIQKAVFQRTFASAGTKNAIANPLLLASWTALLAAADGTKVVPSPYMQAPTTEPGAARTYGGGNETLGGIELIVGREPTTFTANILESKQSTIKALKTYMGETASVFLVDEYGRIGCIADDPETPTEYYGIPVRALFVGDKTFGGLEAPDMNSVQWKMLPNWSDNFVIVTPTDFNALTDLVP
jgi:hypothetical protein